MLNTNSEIVLILPAFNEATALTSLLPRTDECLGGLHRLSVLVVDDGSTDGTPLVVANCRERSCRCISHPENRGFGSALNTGITAALGYADVIVTMDADDTHEPSAIPSLLAALERSCDVAIASRYAPGAIQLGVPVWRQLISRAANRLIALLLRENTVRDFSSGFRAYRAPLLRHLLEENEGTHVVGEGGFAASLELLLAARGCGARVTEVPFCLRYDRKPGPSAMTVVRTLYTCARVLLRTSKLRRRCATMSSHWVQSSAE